MNLVEKWNKIIFSERTLGIQPTQIEQIIKEAREEGVNTGCMLDKKYGENAMKIAVESQVKQERDRIEKAIDKRIRILQELESGISKQKYPDKKSISLRISELTKLKEVLV